MDWDYINRVYKDICWECVNKNKEKERIDLFIDNIDRWIIQTMLRIGMSPREAKAELSRVPMGIKTKLPGEMVKILMSGRATTKGFGIGGNTDAGKTMAIAAIVKSCVIEAAKQRIVTNPIPDSSGREWPSGILWSSWPDEVQWLRAHAISPEAPERVEAMSTVPLLILDDLGRERIKGAYSDDWAASQLDAVINGRYRNELVTIWTTNVTEADLVALYGAALVRRLTADNPLIWIDGLGSAK